MPELNELTELIKSLFFNPALNYDFLAFITATVAVILSFFTYRDSCRKSIERERYDKFIYPLFALLEPYLFSEIPDDVYHKAMGILQENRNILGGKFLDVFYWCNKSKDQSSCLALSTAVNNEFDKVSRILLLKKRTFLYRLNRKQFKSNFAFVCYILLQVITLLLSFAAFLTVTYAVGMILLNLMQ